MLHTLLFILVVSQTPWTVKYQSDGRIDNRDGNTCWAWPDGRLEVLGPNGEHTGRFFNSKYTPILGPGENTSRSTSSSGSDDSLDEVNRARALRGLRPFINDSLLNQGARLCARLRAQQHIHGHLGGNMSDFACLPQGVEMSAAGAGALTPDWGWGTCCTYENYQYAGAAWVMGSDGLRYMSLFVR